MPAIVAPQKPPDTFPGWPRLMTVSQATGYVGGAKNFADLQRHFGLKPTRHAHKNTSFEKADLDRAINEAELSHWQPRPGTDIIPKIEIKPKSNKKQTRP